MIVGVAAVNRDRIVQVRHRVPDIEEPVIDFEIFSSIERQFQEDFVDALGGSVVNTLHVLSRLGLNVYIIGNVGDDNVGRFLLEEMRKYNLKFIGNVVRGLSGRTLILADPEGNRHIHVFPGVNDLLRPEDICNFPSRSDIKLVHTSTFVCSHGVSPIQAQIKVLTHYTCTRSLTFGNLYADMLVREDEKSKHVLRLLESVNILFLNAQELFKVTKRQHVREAMDYLFDLFTNLDTLCVTLGPEGVLVRKRERMEEIYMKPVPVKKVVDSTGAGDAFSAGFLLGILLEEDLRECITLGLELANSCLKHVGGTGYEIPPRVVERARKLLRS